MTSFIEFCIQGLAIGAVYALLSLPLSLVFQATGALDLGIGGYAVVSGLGFAAAASVGSAVIGVVLATAWAAGLGALYLALDRRGLHDPISLALLGIAALFAAQSFSVWRWGADPLNPNVIDGTVTFWGIRVTLMSLIDIAVASGLLALLVGVLFGTPLGRAVRAASSHPRNAELAGIPVTAIHFGGFVAGGVLAGLAGVLLAASRGLTFDAGLPLTLSGFAALILFGLKGPIAAFAGGLTLGLVETLSAGYVSSSWASTVPLLLVLAILSVGRFSGELAGDRP